MSVHTRNTRWTLFWILTLLFPLAACGDSTGPNGGGYFLRFDANGTRVTYTNEATLIASFSQTSGQYLAVFTGYDPTTNMGLQVYDSSPITVATYSGYTLAGGAFVGALIGYQNASGTLFTQGSGANIQSQIKITEISDTAVRGTFSGTLKATGQPDLIITNGEFAVRRMN